MRALTNFSQALSGLIQTLSPLPSTCHCFCSPGSAFLALKRLIPAERKSGSAPVHRVAIAFFSTNSKTLNLWKKIKKSNLKLIHVPGALRRALPDEHCRILRACAPFWLPTASSMVIGPRREWAWRFQFDNSRWSLNVIALLIFNVSGRDCKICRRECKICRRVCKICSLINY